MKKLFLILMLLPVTGFATYGGGDQRVSKEVQVVEYMNVNSKACQANNYYMEDLNEKFNGDQRVKVRSVAVNNKVADVRRFVRVAKVRRQVRAVRFQRVRVVQQPIVIVRDCSNRVVFRRAGILGLFGRRQVQVAVSRARAFCF